jgi:hypothetical protein
VKTTLSRQRIPAALAMVALSILVVPAAKAECRASSHNQAMFAVGPQSLQDPAVMEKEDLSEQADSPQPRDQEQNDSSVTIVGFWKKIWLSGGALNDVGFEQFNVGGTELVNDAPPPAGGNNYCLGAWERIGKRTYSLVHPFFVFDDSGKTAIAIAIEKSQIIVSRDGNTFKGTWTQDNYDFSGNVLQGFHFDGTFTGTRIAPGLPFPFPLPR